MKDIKKLLLICLILLGIFLTFNNKISATSLSTFDKVNENSELTYYIKVSYQDANYLGETIPDIIYIEDKLPEGVEFVDILKFGDIYYKIDYYEWLMPNGYVIGGRDGIVYNEDTRTISFKVAGLTTEETLYVGVIVRTSSSVDRLDFYNSASARHLKQYVISNPVHSYIGNDSSNKNKVKYRITGDLPIGYSIDVPSEKEYTVGQRVSVENVYKIPGYIFNGWYCDVNINNASFIMPNSKVTCTGSFTKNGEIKHKVIYKIIDGVNVNVYSLPKGGEYLPGEIVKFNNTVLQDSNNEYNFIEWIIPDNITFNDSSSGLFTMPNEDVVFAAKFEKSGYFLDFDFVGNVSPVNANLLPPKKEYKPGDTIEITYNYDYTSCINDEDNSETLCRFVGWVSPSTITMPSRNVTINGLWQAINGLFSPSIESEIVEEKEYYKKGDIVTFKTNIKNNEDIDIYNVVIESKLEGQEFSENNNYIVNSNNKRLASIRKLNAKESIDLYSTYKVTEDTDKLLTNELEIISAEGDNGYYLENKVYKASVEFNLKTNNENSGQGSSETPKGNDNTPSEVKPNVPKTIDNINIYISIFSISLSILFVIIFIVIKERRKL